MLNARKDSGFTLIELLVVIAIIGLLASIILASLNSARAKGRDARRIADLKDIQTALELEYSSAGNAYPAAGTAGALPPTLAPTYMATLPTDPGSNSYTYAISSDGQHYCMEARLEGSLPTGAAAACYSTVTGVAPGGSGGSVYFVTQ